MQTDDLISLMAASHRPVDSGRLRRMTWLVALAALAVTAVFVLLSIGVRHDLGSASATLPVLAKVMLGIGVTVVMLSAFQRSLRPGLKPDRTLWLAAAPIALAMGWAILTLLQAPTEQWSALTFGRNWRACIIAIPLYAMVPFIVLLGVARRGAPIDGRLTGAFAGFASAGLSTIAYALHCPEDTAPFLAIWYPLAMAFMTGLGAVVFPRLVRW